MRLREREVRDAFHAAGAVNPAAAMSLESIGIDETLAVRRLKKRAVIREAAPGLFYFDEDVWEAVRSMRRRMALLLVGTVTLVLLLIAYGVVTLQ
jgi:predicted acetyltransferase